MQKLWLDFQRPPPGYRWPGIVLLVCAIAASIALLMQYNMLSRDTEQRSQHIARLKRDIERHRLFESTVEERSGEHEQNASIPGTRATAQWQDLFTTLDSAADESVTLLGLDTRSDGITLTGEAKNLAAATAYVKRLQSSTTLTKVHLTEQGVLKEHPQHPTSFTAIADWKPVAP